MLLSHINLSIYFIYQNIEHTAKNKANVNVLFHKIQEKDLTQHAGRCFTRGRSV